MAALPQLSRALLRDPAFTARTGVRLPDPALLDLPEKAVQFGTGAFLRGFVEHFVDEANHHGRFAGRIVAVGSTGSGRDEALRRQDGLYTLQTQGVAGGEARREHRVIASLSRALSAVHEWDAVLACARNSSLELVFSNTTEVGIVLDEHDRPDAGPPRSFPGKLTRFLFERARTFAFSRGKGVVVLPCELVEGNGDRLRDIVLELATRWSLGRPFVRWVEQAVPFCNTLVDRIVPGAPPVDERESLFESLGYRDELLTTCESYRLFAIQGDAALRERLGFGEEAGVVVTDDTAPYRERKVRLLNGAHTAMVPAAILAGCETVRDAVSHELVGPFLRRVLFEEILSTVDAPGAEAFARDVLDRFANPYIRHALIDITLQGTMKYRVRVVPSLVRYAEHFGRVPQGLAFGFAAYLIFMRGDVQEARRRAGLSVPPDDQGGRVRALWDTLDDDSDSALAALVQSAAADASLWGTQLTRIPGFTEVVTDHLLRLRRDGPAAALDTLLAAAPAL